MKGRKKKNKKQPDLPAKSDSSQASRFPVFSDRFREDLGWWYKTDKQKAPHILDLVSEVMKEPFSGIGKPEPLKYLDPDTWSRRIDLENRLVYRVRAERIDFLKARYHYRD